MKIIGHRGAAGLALENSLESIKTAVKAGVDAVEIDVRLTKDNRLVLSHDRSTGRVGSSDLLIHTNNLKDLKSITLNNGEKLSTLEEAITAAGPTSLFIEAKGSGWAEALARVIKKRSKTDVTVISFNHDELSRFHKRYPNVPVYALERSSPFDIIHTARKNKFTGIDVNFWILNPLTYWLARRAGLEIVVYTVNNAWIARLLKVLYPRISLTTDYPDKLMVLKKR